MRIELLVLADCPHTPDAVAMLRQALDDVGLGRESFDVVVLASEAAAVQRHFIGSPTFAAGGQDLFAEPGRPAALACRVYPEAGPLPSPDLLRQALSRAAASPLARSV